MEDRRKLDPPPSLDISDNYSEMNENDGSLASHDTGRSQSIDNRIPPNDNDKNVDKKVHGVTYLAIPNDLDFNDEEAVLKFFAGVKNKNQQDEKIRIDKQKEYIKNEEDKRNSSVETQKQGNKDNNNRQEDAGWSVREKWNENVIVSKISRENACSSDVKSGTIKNSQYFSSQNGVGDSHELGESSTQDYLLSTNSNAETRYVVSRQKEAIRAVLLSESGDSPKQTRTKFRKNSFCSQSEGNCTALSPDNLGMLQGEKIDHEFQILDPYKTDPPEELLDRPESIMSDLILSESESSSLQTPIQFLHDSNIEQKTPSRNSCNNGNVFEIIPLTRDILIDEKFSLTLDQKRKNKTTHLTKQDSKERPRESLSEAEENFEGGKDSLIYCRACGNKLKILRTNTFNEKWCVNSSCSHFMIPSNDLGILFFDDYDSNTANATVPENKMNGLDRQQRPRSSDGSNRRDLNDPKMVSSSETMDVKKERIRDSKTNYSISNKNAGVDSDIDIATLIQRLASAGSVSKHNIPDDKSEDIASSKFSSSRGGVVTNFIK